MALQSINDVFKTILLRNLRRKNQQITQDEFLDAVIKDLESVKSTNTDAIETVTDSANIDLTLSNADLTADLTDTAVTPGTKGDATNSAQVTVDQKGRVTSLTQTPISFPADFIQSISDTNTVDLDVTAANLTGNVRYQDTTEIDLSDDAGGLKADLKTTTVTPGTYGDATNVSQVTFDSKGRATVAANVPITFPSDFIQSISDTNTVDLDVTANNLTANIKKQDTTEIALSDDASGIKADLKTTAITPGTYGDANNVSQVTFDSKGRATGAADVPIAFPADYIQSVSDTNTIDLTVAAANLTADLRKQNTATINLSDDASGLKADFASMNISQFTNDSGYVQNTRTLTIGGTNQDLSANRTWYWTPAKRHLEVGETVTVLAKYEQIFHSGIINQGTIINQGIIRNM